MAALDALKSPELSALLRLERGEAMNMQAFSHAAKASPVSARRALKTLEGLKLVTVRKTPQGNAKIAHIELTAAGKRVARHVAAIEALLSS